jgi:hypothetical protein
MDQKLCDRRAVLLIRRHIQLELHCADYASVITCQQNSTPSSHHLRQNFIHPKLASFIDGEWREETYARTCVYDRVQDLGKHVDLAIEGGTIVRTGQPLFDSYFSCRFHYV